MLNKLSFLAGLGAGYVAGARSGHTRYEQIKSTSAKAWQSEPVQAKVAAAADAVKAKAPAPAAKLVDKAVDAVSGGTAPASSKTSVPATGRDASFAANPVGMSAEADGHPS